MAPLWQLCIEETLERVRVALRRGEDVNSKDGHDETALMFAVEMKHNRIVRLLLEQPAIEVNNRERVHGKTALHLAAYNNNVEAAQLLLSNQQIEVNCKDNRGWTALHWAANRNNVEAMQLLLANQQTEVNCQDNGGQTVLHWAAADNNVEAMQLLLANQQVDVNCQDNRGMTALHWAANKNNVETKQLLLANQQVDVNLKTNNGNTALHLAAGEDNANSIRMLLAHPKFNLANHVNVAGNTPAMVAAINQNRNALKELVDHQSVDLDILDRNGRSLNQIAAWFVQCTPLLEGAQHDFIEFIHLRATPLHPPPPHGKFVIFFSQNGVMDSYGNNSLKIQFVSLLVANLTKLSTGNFLIFSPFRVHFKFLLVLESHVIFLLSSNGTKITQGPGTCARQ